MSTQSPAPSARSTSRWGQRVDAFTAALLLLFAFLSASFIARNSDLWLHLASGRSIASGSYGFGHDPFAYTTEHQYWTNHSWLFDLGFYYVREWFGDAAAVEIKAAMVAAIAALMLVGARGKGPDWISSICLLLGLMALSQRLPLQPVVASYLFLVLTLCCLSRGGKALYAIPVLIALWVNIDAWFILGPFLVVLFWLARRLSPTHADPPEAWPRWLVPCSLLACLLNPHHIHAFELPFELSPAVRSSSLAGDPRFASLFASPWHWRQLGTAGGYNLGAWAFFILLGLGIVSFALNRGAIRSWRGIVWLAFAALAAWQVRLVPFFAVVGAPICALNLRETFPSTAVPQLGRAFALFACLAVTALGILGWANGFHNRDRGVAWGIHTDATLQRAAECVAWWKSENPASTSDRLFTTNIDLGHYMAWFAPGQMCFLDSRFQLFTQVANDYEAMCRTLGLLPDEHESDGRQDELFQNYGITGIELYDPDSQRMTNALRQTASGENRRWDVARVDGGAVFLTRKGSINLDRRFDPERAAFATNGEVVLPRAGNGPAALAELAPGWLVEPSYGRSGSWEADAATIYLRLFEESRSPERGPALLFLAVRAARVGIEKDPRDSVAWLMLARAYQQLGLDPWERKVGEELTPLARIRRIQTATALVQAVICNPDLAPAQDSLARVFQSEGAFDLALKHTTESLRLIRRAGPGAWETPEEYAVRVAAITNELNRLEAIVQVADTRHLIRTAELAGDPFARARIAVDLGLIEKAIDILRGSHPDLYGAKGLDLLLDLFLRTGRVVEARALLDRAELRQHPEVLGLYSIPGKAHADGQGWSFRFLAYDWHVLCEKAAVGSYDGAKDILHLMEERFSSDERSVAPLFTRDLARQIASEVGLGVPQNSALVRLARGWEGYWRRDRFRQSRLLTVSRGDLTTIAAMLELERGNALAAREQGEAALALYASRKGSSPVLPGQPLAERLVETIRRAGH